MRNVLLALILSVPAFGALLSGPRFMGSTATQVVIYYAADNGPCGISTSPAAYAVDPTLFAGSDYTGQIKTDGNYTVVIGKRTSALATDGRMYSLALQNETSYTVTVTCSGSSPASVVATTLPVPFGAAATQPPPLDPNTPGGIAWPTVRDWTSTTDVYIDPQTGQPLTMLTPARQSTADQTTAKAFDSFGSLDGVWTLTGGVLPANYTWPGSGTPGSVFLRAEALTGTGPLSWEWGFGANSLDWYEPTITGTINNASCTTGSTGLDACKVQVSLTNNGVTPVTKWLDCELGQVSKTCVAAPAHTPIMEEWRSGPYPLARPDFVTFGKQTTMVMSVAGDGSTLTWVSGPQPQGYWANGALAKIGSTYCSITGVSLGNSKIVNMTSSSCFAAFAGTNQNVIFPTVGVLIRKKSQSTDAVRITAATYKYGQSDAVQNPDTGSVQSCSAPVDGGVICNWGTSGGIRYLYFLKPDGTTNLIGRIAFSAKSTGYKWNSIAVATGVQHSNSDPRTFFATGTDNSSKLILLMARLNDPNHTAAVNQTGNSFLGTSNGDTCAQDVSNSYHQICTLNGYAGGLDIWALTPGDLNLDLDTQFANFNPWYGGTNPQLAFKGRATITGFQNGLLTGFIRAGGVQDKVSMTWAFDPGDLNPLHAGTPTGPHVVGLTSSIGDNANNLGNFPLRWCVHHAQLNFGFASPVAAISGNSVMQAAGSANGAGPWIATIVNADGTVATTMTADQTVIYIKGWASPDPSTGLANNFTDPSPFATEVWPNGPVQAGDYIALAAGGITAVPGGGGSGGDGSLRETIQVLSVDKSTSLWKLTIRRAVGAGFGGGAPAQTLTADGVTTWIFGTAVCGCQNFDAFYTQGVTTGGYCFWNFTADPTGANTNFSTYLSSTDRVKQNANFDAACLPGFGAGCLTIGKDQGNQASHETYRPNIYSENLNGGLTPNGKSAYVMRRDTNGVFTYPTVGQTYEYYSLPTFHGASASADTAWQSHNTSGPQSSTDTRHNGQIWDAVPFFNGLHSATFALTYPDSTPTTTTWWFRGTVADSSHPDDISGAVLLNRKRWPTWANGGHWMLRDISGPSCSWVDGLAGAYTYAVVRKANECRSGTVPGDIFINLPYAWDLGTCPTSSSSMYTSGGGEHIAPCIGNSMMLANTAAAQVVPNGIGDFIGTAIRRITSGMSIPDRGYPFWTPRTTEDGAWLIPFVPWFGMARSTLLKTPYPNLPNSDAVTRSYFTPVVVQLPSAPAGATKAWIRFGYEEYGCVKDCVPSTTRHAYCTSRLEDCVVTAPSYDADLAAPFSFVSSDSAAGVACASGCKITIPALSGLTLFYWAEWLDNSSALVSSSQTIAVPVS